MLKLLDTGMCAQFISKRGKNKLREKEGGELHNNNIDLTANVKMRGNLLGLVFIMLAKVCLIHFALFLHPFSFT